MQATNQELGELQCQFDAQLILTRRLGGKAGSYPGSPAAIDTHVDVAVVGAGPAGLAVALGLREAFGPDLKIKVFDKATSMRPIGASVTIQGNGLNALRACSTAADDALKAAGRLVCGMEFRNEHDQTLRAAPFPTDASASLMVSWFEMQQALLGVLGREHVVLNKTLTGLQQTADGPVTLTFQDGSEVTSHVVVGADGNMSATRTALFPEEGRPQYVGLAIWRTRIAPVPDVVTLPTGWLAMWAHPELSSTRIGMRNFGDHITITGIAKWPEERLQELWRKSYYGQEDLTRPVDRQAEKLKRAEEVLTTGLPPSISSLITTSDPSVLIEHGLYWREWDKPWVKDRVALVGDAAAIYPPIFGQGTSIAFEGAYWVVHKLASHLSKVSKVTGTSPLDVLRDPSSRSLINEALMDYQQTQQPRVGVISRGSLASEKDATLKIDPLPEEDAKVTKGVPIMQFVQDGWGDALVPASSFLAKAVNVDEGDVGTQLVSAAQAVLV